MPDVICVFRTGHLYQVDMADSALKYARIPHFMREESVSGLVEAMPAAPSMGPGVWWSIVVPEGCADTARSVLAEMPFEITMNPGVWDHQAGGESGPFARWFRVAAVIALAVIVYSIVAAMTDAF